jgi:O-antigen/teichoic acid export membrane protein
MGVLGLYGLSYKFAMTLPVLFGQPLTLMWGPYAFDMARREGGKALIASTATYFFLGMSIYAAALGALMPEVIRVMAAPKFFEAHRPAPLLLGGFVLLASVTLFETGLLIERRTEWRALSIAGAAGINLLANFLLIPRFGMMGAAAATTAGCAVAFAVTLVGAQRVCPMPYEWTRLAKVAAATVAAFCLARTISLPSLPLAVAAKSAALATVPLWLWALRFFEPGELAGLRSAIGKAFVPRGAEA